MYKTTKCTDLHSYYTELSVPSLHRLQAFNDTVQLNNDTVVNFALCRSASGQIYNWEKNIFGCMKLFFFYQKINIQCAEVFKYVQNLQKTSIQCKNSKTLPN